MHDMKMPHRWIILAGGASFVVGAFRNVMPGVQAIADINNALLPLWMIVLGASLVWRSGKRKSPVAARNDRQEIEASHEPKAVSP